MKKFIFVLPALFLLTGPSFGKVADISLKAELQVMQFSVMSIVCVQQRMITKIVADLNNSQDGKSHAKATFTDFKLHGGVCDFASVVITDEKWRLDVLFAKLQASIQQVQAEGGQYIAVTIRTEGTSSHFIYPSITSFD